MGSVKKTRSKYSGPSHPWQRARMEEEAPLKKEYGLKNKTEIWKMNSFMKKIKFTAKKLISLTTEQAQIEKAHLIAKINNYGFLGQKAVRAEDALNITLKNMLERRLQTQVVKKGLARSVNQARQMITHRHITVDGKMITSPSYIVRVSEESKIAFASRSGFLSADHPERAAIAMPKKEVRKEEPRESRGRDGKRRDTRRPMNRSRGAEKKGVKKEDKKAEPKAKKGEEKK